MTDANGESGEAAPALQLSDVLYIETKEGASIPFEVVGILEDAQENASYAVLLHEGSDEEEQEFIVTDLEGNLLRDTRVAQEVLDDFLGFAEESSDGRSSHNGEQR
jgi:hypothetical protein